MAASKQRLPGGAETRKPGEGMHRGALRLRGGPRSFRRRRQDGQPTPSEFPNFNQAKFFSVFKYMIASFFGAVTQPLKNMFEKQVRTQSFYFKPTDQTINKQYI